MLSDPSTLTEKDEQTEAESDRLHAYVGWVLRVGLGASVLLLVAGMIVRLGAGVDDAPAVRLWDFAVSGGDLGLRLTTLGVLVLAMTPALRVLALVALWWRERDWRFVAVALAVAVTLSAGILMGKGG